MPEQSETVIVIVALGLALVGALVAVVATKVVLGMIEFVAGGGIAVLLVGNLGIDSGVVALAVFLIAGLIGGVLLLVLSTGPSSCSRRWPERGGHEGKQGRDH